MTLDELEYTARTRKSLTAKMPGGHRAWRSDVLLVVPRKSPPTGKNVRLAGRFGPLSECIANVKKTEDGYEVVAYFDADKILNFVERARNVE